MREANYLYVAGDEVNMLDGRDTGVSFIGHCADLRGCIAGTVIHSATRRDYTGIMTGKLRMLDSKVELVVLGWVTCAAVERI